MQAIPIVISAAAATDVDVYAEIPFPCELVSATITQTGASVAAHSTNYSTVTIGNNSDTTIATVTTVAGLTKGTPVSFTMSGPENAVLSAGQRFSIKKTHANSGAELQALVMLKVVKARLY